MRDDLYLTSRKNSLELIELSSIIKLVYKFFVCLHGDKTIIVLFVETPRKFITAKIFCSNKFTWCFNKQNYYKLV